MSDTAPSSLPAPPASDPSVQEAIDQFVGALPSEYDGNQSADGIITTPAVAPPPPEKKEEKPPVEDPRFARGFQRLAQKEEALSAREAALQAKEQGLSKASQTGLVQKFRSNPLRTLRELGLDNDQIAQMGRAALGATLDGAPQPYRDLAEKFRLDDQNEDVKSELAKLREEWKAEKEQTQVAQRQAEFRQVYHSDLTKYVGSQELSKEAPTVSRLYAADPEETTRRLYDVVARDAQARLRSGAVGEPLSPSQAAAALEKELAPFARAFGGQPSEGQNARAQDATARRTLSDSAVNPAPTSRTAPDPETDWEGWKKVKEAEWLAELHRKTQLQ